jgi:hypothetical protein
VSEQRYCSELARAANEPLRGTAEQVHAWLLIEYREAFRPRALEDNVLPAAVNAWIGQVPERVAAASGECARVQFIRGARSARAGEPIRVYVARVDAGGGRLFAADLADHAVLASLDAVALVRGEAPLAAVTERLYLVCTNGQRDVCCARFGLPVYEHLSGTLGDCVWQTTHVGGHRFAPNLVCLPSGAVYGFASRDVVDGLVAADRAGELALAHLRGRSFAPTEVQVAEHVLRERAGLRGLQALRCIASEQVGERRHRVTFVDAGGVRHVADAWCEAEPVLVQASCGDGGRKPLERWHAAVFTR